MHYYTQPSHLTCRFSILSSRENIAFSGYCAHPGPFGNGVHPKVWKSSVPKTEEASSWRPGLQHLSVRSSDWTVLCGQGGDSHKSAEGTNPGVHTQEQRAVFYIRIWRSATTKSLLDIWDICQLPKAGFGQTLPGIRLVVSSFFAVMHSPQSHEHAGLNLAVRNHSAYLVCFRLLCSSWFSRQGCPSRSLEVLSPSNQEGKQLKAWT